MRVERWMRRTIPAVLAALVTATPAASQDWKTDFSRRTVPQDEIVPVVPRDAIPAIDDPVFVSVAEADRWLGDREPVAVVTRAGSVHVYPLQILIWHEIVNDVVGGEPISVTYCPLCNTTLAFERRFDDRLLDFGTTGSLRHSDLVMYDRQTETWWQQATGEAIVGRYAGERLAFVPAPVYRWSDVRDRDPEARVLSRETGHDRPYGTNPYRGYDTRSGPFAWAFRGRTDNRLDRMERVVTLDDPDRPLAVPFSALVEHGVVETTAFDQPVVVFWAPGTASAVDDGVIGSGRDVGSGAAFSPVVDGRRLRFASEGSGRFTDRQTGSSWDVTGRAVDGALEGTRLEPVQHGNHFWFAWVVFRPETRVVRP